MARIVVEGKDKLLMALAPEFGNVLKVVKLSKSDKDTLRQAIAILEKAAELWYEANDLDEDSITDNPYAVAEVETRTALEY